MMKTKFKNRRIEINCLSYEEVLFDIGTTKICTQFNGLGGFNYYNYADNKKFNIKAESFFNIYINDEIMDLNTKKKVICGGRIQKIIWSHPLGKIELTQFGYESFIFNKFSFSFKENVKVDVVYDYTKFVDVPTLIFNKEFDYIDPNYSYHIKLEGTKNKYNCVIAFIDNPKKVLPKTNSILKELNNEIDLMRVPEICDTEEKKVIYISSMFTALENFKSINGFEAFAAGINYLVPFRTYFRDSYWTTLCLYKDYPELIKKQIIALAKGISSDGECPSAVKTDYTGFWGGHYDSPCFFVMMVSNYINQTKDNQFLQYKINDVCLIDLCKKVIDRIKNTLTDKTHLMIKNGHFNRLDWADAVNREGYVTYDECLYYYALKCFYNLSNDKNYLEEANLVKESINNILWDEKLGYYINYKNEKFVEDNLSIDTILTVLFGIVPKNKKEKLIDKFEEILYSKNHKELKDFGVMCVYPNYKHHETVLSISGQAYRYHNSSNWPYWSGMFAYLLMQNGRDYSYAINSCFIENIKHGNLTPLEYFSPYYKVGSNLQAWSSTSAFAFSLFKDKFF